MRALSSASFICSVAMNASTQSSSTLARFTAIALTKQIPSLSGLVAVPACSSHPAMSCPHSTKQSHRRVPPSALSLAILTSGLNLCASTQVSLRSTSGCYLFNPNRNPRHSCDILPESTRVPSGGSRRTFPIARLPSDVAIHDQYPERHRPPRHPR